MRIRYARSFDARVTQEYVADITDPDAMYEAMNSEDDDGWPGEELDQAVLADADMESEEFEMSSDPMMTATVELLDPDRDIEHVLPLDLQHPFKHERSPDCWCQPTGDGVDGRWLYQHQDRPGGPPDEATYQKRTAEAASAASVRWRLRTDRAEERLAAIDDLLAENGPDVLDRIREVLR